MTLLPMKKITEKTLISLKEDIFADRNFYMVVQFLAKFAKSLYPQKL